MNDSYGNDDNVRRTLGPPSVYLNRIDIERLGLQCGQPAELHNDTGQLTLVVEESDRVAAGVALAYKGRWPKLEGGRQLAKSRREVGHGREQCSARRRGLDPAERSVGSAFFRKYATAGPRCRELRVPCR